MCAKYDSDSDNQGPDHYENPVNNDSEGNCTSDPVIIDSAAECADADDDKHLISGDTGINENRSMPNDASSNGPADNEDTVTNGCGGNGDSDPGILVSVAEC